jgi:hypothetical protein
MLPCKQRNCVWHLAYLNWSGKNRSDPLHRYQGIIMSKTASLGLMPSASLFGRMMTTIDRLLMAHASLTIRNGDLPYPGL